MIYKNKICKNCKNEFSIHRQNKRNIFCSKSCAATYNNKISIKRNKVVRYCYCGKKLRRYDKKYCSSLCLKKYNYLIYINKWKINEVSGGVGEFSEILSAYVRHYIFEKYNNKCFKCGWKEINQYTNKIPLTINHIDGNPLNHKEENLELLCPNCHSLTEFYGSRGKGRKGRYKK